MGDRERIHRFDSHLKIILANIVFEPMWSARFILFSFFIQLLAGVARLCYPLSTIFLCFWFFFTSLSLSLLSSSQIFSFLSLRLQTKANKNNPMMRLWVLFEGKKRSNLGFFFSPQDINILFSFCLNFFARPDVTKPMQYWQSYQTNQNDPNL